MVTPRVKDTRLQPVIDSLRGWDTLNDARLTALEGLAQNPSTLPPGMIGFITGTLTVLESNTGDGVDIEVSRSAGSKGAVSVRLTDLGTGTATAGVDYTAVPTTTLSWADGEATTQAITLLPLNASSADKTVILGLSALNADGTALPLTPSLGVDEVTVTIKDVSSDPDLVIAWADNSSLSGAQVLTGNPTLSGDLWFFAAEEPFLAGEALVAEPPNVSVHNWYYGDGPIGNQATLDAFVDTDDEFIVDDPHFQGSVDGVPSPFATAAEAPGGGGATTEAQVGAYMEPTGYKWQFRTPETNRGESPEASPNNWFFHLDGTGGTTDHYAEGRAANRYLRTQADIALNGGTEAADSTDVIDEWADMDETKCWHTGNTGPGSGNSRISTGGQVMSHVFIAARDLGYNDAGFVTRAKAHRDRIKTILAATSPIYNETHNFRVNLLQVAMSADAAANDSGDEFWSTWKTHLDDFIDASYPGNGVNLSEQTHPSDRTLHYDGVEGSHVLACVQLLRQNSLDLSASAQAAYEQFCADKWATWVAYVADDPVPTGPPFTYTTGSGTWGDIGPLGRSEFGAFMEWAVVLGFHPGPVPSKVRGLTSNYGLYAPAPKLLQVTSSGGGTPGSEPTITAGTPEAFESGTNSMTVSSLGTHVAGDYLVITCQSKGTPGLTIDNSWLDVDTLLSGNGTTTMAFYKVATSASETIPTVTRTGANGDNVLTVWRVQDTSGINAKAFATTASPTYTAPAVTTTSDNCRVMRGVVEDTSTAWAWSTSTEQYDTITGAGNRVTASGALVSKTTAGTLAAETVTPTGGTLTGCTGFTIAFAPVVTAAVGTAADGAHWIAYQPTHTRSGGPASTTTIGEQFQIDNSEPTVPTTGLVTTGLMSERFGFYSGGSQGSVNAENVITAQLGVTPYVYHEFSAPSQGDIATGNLGGIAQSTLAHPVPRLISWQSYDDRDWVQTAAPYTSRAATPNLGGHRVDTVAAAQAAAYDAVVAGTSDSKLDTCISHFKLILGATDFLAIEWPGQELSGNWQGHAPILGNESKHLAMATYVHDYVNTALTADERLRTFWVWSHPKRDSRGTDHTTWYPGDTTSSVTGRSLVDVHSVNIYIDVAQASEHITPAGPFGTLANKDNIIAAGSRQAVIDRLFNFSDFGVAQQVAFAIEKGKPIAMGEGGPGVGKSGDPGWCGDDGTLMTMYLQWIHDNIVLSPVGLAWFVMFNSSAGGVGSKLGNDMPNSMAAIANFLAGH